MKSIMKHNILQEKSFAFAVYDAEELCKILSKIIITTKNKLSQNPLNS